MDNWEQKDPGVLANILSVLILHLFGRTPRHWCNTTLKMLKLSLEKQFTVANTKMTLRQETLLKNFPTDVRTVRKAFHLEAETTTFAACPKCSCTYAPTKEGQIQVYPAVCNWRRFPSSKACGEPLVTSRVVEGESVRWPVRPFVVQNFDAFLGRLLSRPGMEDLLDRGTVFNNEAEIWDIKDGEAISELKGPDGLPFLDGLKRKELRLVWSLSVDWFNPFTNRAAGKAMSTGSIVMALLNLPPSLRIQQQNFYLHAIIPGPKEPSVEQINHFLSPLVHQLNSNYHRGAWFSQSAENRQKGRTSRSMVVVTVSDLPASRKIHGQGSHSCNVFLCAFCELNGKNITNLDRTSWKPRTVADLRRAAEEWRDAPSQSQRNKLFKKNGVRWTELWRLSYYNPLTMISVDGMHALFERIIPFHLRDVLGIDKSQADDDVVNTQDLAAAISLFNSGASHKRILNLRQPVLQALCGAFNATLPILPKGRRYRKVQLFEALQHVTVSFCHNHLMSSPID